MPGRGGGVVRGALATVVGSSLGSVVTFQYNPESITRTLRPQVSVGDGEEHAQDVQFADAPTQTISFTAYFDASDALQVGDETAVKHGIAPQLALLETLAYPRRSAIADLNERRKRGELNIQAPPTDSVILVWGNKRVFPVRITGLTIKEDVFDAALNPIQASAQIDVEVLTYGKSVPEDGDYLRFFAYHGALENDAALVVTATSDVKRVQSLLKTSSRSLDEQNA
jgi:hypothetical protein